ncbi:MAG: hypothetical protein CV087_05545, partial [Candidatus Brocadia sp. WS118]
MSKFLRTILAVLILVTQVSIPAVQAQVVPYVNLVTIPVVTMNPTILYMPSTYIRLENPIPGQFGNVQSVWGLDLSQSLQGAGGIGGLLTMFDGVGSYAYLYDGNG